VHLAQKTLQSLPPSSSIERIYELFLDILLYYPPPKKPPPKEGDPPLPPSPIVGLSSFGLTRLLAPKSPFSKSDNFNKTSELSALKSAVLKLISPNRCDVFSATNNNNIAKVHAATLLLLGSTDPNGVTALLAANMLKSYLDYSHSNKLEVSERSERACNKRVRSDD